MPDLRKIESFGDIAAESDAVLKYFLTTDAARSIEAGHTLLVLGRKGSGKTALVRHFTETQPRTHGKPLSLRSYPWTTHAGLVDQGAAKNEAYVASWKLLIAIRLASMVCDAGQNVYTDSIAALQKFLMDNFGTIDPETGAIFAQKALKVVGLTFSPQVAGFSLGSINFGRDDGSKVLGLELNSLTSSILKDVSSAIAELKIERLFLHFDELDQGLINVDDERGRLLIGLILAAREISLSNALRANIRPVIYLRTDIWQQLDFSDKNKIAQSSSIHLVWNENTLLEMINARLTALSGEPVSWSQIEDAQKMRGSQSKWLHLLSRTMLRPRDVIQFLNIALRVAKSREDVPLLFNNGDINETRETYSRYLKSELDDEIIPHWTKWSEALSACSRIQTITFKSDQFQENYRTIKSIGNERSSDEALELLFRFSVIGYERRPSSGGSSWVFNYSDGDAAWDASAPRYKVHQGLKEFAKLKEERQGASDHG
jgi:energy-coupling factor transporter ATP-binding protein EcfA2